MPRKFPVINIPSKFIQAAGYIYQENNYGDKFWYLDGLRHREDGPAIEYANGGKKWYRHGLLHRLDGPAIIWPDLTKEWFTYGYHHREDGPAIELYDGTKEWYLCGRKVLWSKYKNIKNPDNCKYPLLVKSLIIYHVHDV